MFAFGDIGLARFPFTDLSGDKRRPALVVSKASSGGGVILCFITSVPRSGPATVSINPNASNGLKKVSVICFNKVATLNTRLITGKLGMVSVEWLGKHGPTFHGVFGFPVGNPTPNAL